MFPFEFPVSVLWHHSIRIPLDRSTFNTLFSRTVFVSVYSAGREDAPACRLWISGGGKEHGIVFAQQLKHPTRHFDASLAAGTEFTARRRQPRSQYRDFL